MTLFMNYLFFCALPLLLAWLAIVGSLLLLIRLSERHEQQAHMPPPTGGLEQVLRRWKEPGALESQRT
jgi:hypothetical protein